MDKFVWQELTYIQWLPVIRYVVVDDLYYMSKYATLSTPFNSHKTSLPHSLPPVLSGPFRWDTVLERKPEPGYGSHWVNAYLYLSVRCKQKWLGILSSVKRKVSSIWSLTIERHFTCVKTIWPQVSTIIINVPLFDLFPPVTYEWSS